MNTFSNRVADLLLSLVTGLALLAAARTFYGIFVVHVPDAMMLPAADPLARLAFARLILFVVLVTALALPLSWPLARYASGKALETALPGAACALVLFLLIERTRYINPFPIWLDLACGAVLFAGLPLAATFWWRSGLRRIR